MAVNKRKILESAQKFLQKGALDKALKEYKTLLEVDPRDSSSRLKLGDIHLRLGERDEAVAAYLKVAQQFMKDGFDAKAVALFKQIVKLAPAQIDLYVPLAELYQRLGLASEAMAALQTATEGFRKAGRKREALELLRKAAALDPTNTTSRLKIADLLRQQGMTDEALNEYDEIATELERSGEAETLAQVYERVLEIEPERVPPLLALSRMAHRTRDFERALQFAERAANLRPDLIDAIELQADSLQALGRPEQETEPILRRLADLHRVRGDEGRAREILQRLGTDSGFTLSGEEVAPPPPPPPTSFVAGEVFDDLTQAAAKLGPRTAAPKPAAPPPPPPAAARPAAAAPAAPFAQGEVEQMLAEAGVYLRFGKREKAIASLEAILAQLPDHPGALEKLAGALAQDGDLERAAALFSRGVEAARARGDAAGVARFGARLGEVDPEAAAPGGDFGGDSAVFVQDGRHALVEPAAAAPTPVAARQPEPDASHELEFEVEIGSPGSSGPAAPVEPASAEASSAEVTPTGFRSEIDVGPELQLDAEVELMAEDERSAAAPVDPASASELELPIEDEIPIEDEFVPPVAGEGKPAAARHAPIEPSEPLPLDLPEEIAALPEIETPAAPAPLHDHDGTDTPVVPASPKQILEDLEEADFYFKQGLLAEATDVYRRVLDAAPTNPQALLRLGEIAAAQGDDPGSGRPEASPAAALEDTKPDLAEASETDATLGDDLVHWDDAAQDGRGAASSPGLEMALEDSSELSADDEGAVSGDAQATPENSHFDLAAELSDAFNTDPGRPGSAGPLAAETQGSLEAIFSEFKRGVRKTITVADLETHYDLGIAYREMGLLEDALGEFQMALESPRRRLDCLHLLGLCSRDLKRPQDAIAFLRQALSEPELAVERRAAIGFDLGLALEESGDAVAALEALEDVASVAPSFSGLAERLDALRSQLRESPAVESASSSVEPPVEVYESFDDVIADAESSLAFDRDVESEPAAIVDPDPESPPEPAAPAAPSAATPNPAPDEPPPKPPRGTSPRRRKISFG